MLSPFTNYAHDRRATYLTYARLTIKTIQRRCRIRGGGLPHFLERYICNQLYNAQLPPGSTALPLSALVAITAGKATIEDLLYRLPNTGKEPARFTWYSTYLAYLNYLLIPTSALKLENFERCALMYLSESHILALFSLAQTQTGNRARYSS